MPSRRRRSCERDRKAAVSRASRSNRAREVLPRPEVSPSSSVRISLMAARTGQQPVLGPPHLAHAALADPLDQLVGADLTRVLQVHAEPVDDARDRVGQDREHVARRQEVGRHVQRPERCAGHRSRHAEGHRPHGGGQQGGEEHLGRRVRHDERIGHEPHALRRGREVIPSRRVWQPVPELPHGDPKHPRDLEQQPEVEQARRAQDAAAHDRVDSQPHPDRREAEGVGNAKVEGPARDENGQRTGPEVPDQDGTRYARPSQPSRRAPSAVASGARDNAR